MLWVWESVGKHRNLAAMRYMWSMVTCDQVLEGGLEVPFSCCSVSLDHQVIQLQNLPVSHQPSPTPKSSPAQSGHFLVILAGRFEVSSSLLVARHSLYNNSVAPYAVYVSVALPVTLLRACAAFMLGSLDAGGFGPPSALSGSTGGMDVRGATFGPGLRSRWRAAVAANARETVSLKLSRKKVRRFPPERETNTWRINRDCRCIARRQDAQDSKPLLYQY